MDIVPKGGYDVQTDGRHTKGRRPRRQFADEFKAQAVRLVLEDGKIDRRGGPRSRSDRVGAARVGRASPAPTAPEGGPGLTTAEREELARLRKENRELRTERDILKKAAAFFAKHQA